MRTPPYAPRLYRVLKALDAAYRRVHRHPIFHYLVRNGRKTVILVAMGLPLLATAGFLYERTHTQFVLLTGPHGATSTQVGAQIADALNEPTGIEEWLHLKLFPTIVPAESCGSLDNIAMLNRGVAQLVFVEDGLPMHIHAPPACLLHTREDTQVVKETNAIRLRAVMPLYRAPLHVLSRKKLNIQDVGDIQPNSRIYVGPEGGATAFVAQLVLQHEGIVYTRAGENWDFDLAMKALLDGKIDVAFS